MVLGKKAKEDAEVAMAKEQERESGPPPSSGPPADTPPPDPPALIRARADAELAARAVQKPSMGRVVHYTDREGVTFPATVVDVDLTQPMAVGLYVMTMKGARCEDSVPYSEADHTDASRHHSWRWPPRV